MQLARHVDVRLEGQGGIEHRLDALDACGVDRELDAMGVRRRLLHDVAPGHLVEAREQLVVLGEVGVPQHVGGDQRVLGERVAVHQERAARVAGKHHLEDLRVAHALAHQLVDVAHAEGPVRHAHRQAVHRDLGHEARRRELEIYRVVIQAEALGERFDARGVLLQLAQARASCLKNSRIARHTSSCAPSGAMPAARPRALSSPKISASWVSRGRNVATPPVST
jgi:hypothetical protein